MAAVKPAARALKRAARWLADRPRSLQRFWRALGPGVVTGAADDDPSGIATYSIAGAQFGTSLLWTALLTWPLMAAVQTMCARIGMVTGRGLMAGLRRKFPQWVLVPAGAGLLVANTINIGADLSGMADAAELLTGVNSHVWVGLFGVAIGWATVRLRYGQIARVLKWLALVLFVYVVAAVRLQPDWGAIAGLLLPPPGRLDREDGPLGGDPRHHHQSLPLLLAGKSGGRGGKGARAGFARRAPRCKR